MRCGRRCRDRFLNLGRWLLFPGLQASEEGGGGGCRTPVSPKWGGGDWSQASCSASTPLQCADVGAGPVNIL